MSDLVFTYPRTDGKVYKVNEIVSEGNFMIIEDEDTGRVLNLILKHGVKELADFFDFKDKNFEIISCLDTDNWGTFAIGKLTMVNKEGQEFYGIGEINNLNFTSKKAPYPAAVIEKRARSRAILWELGVDAYGEEEAESFSDIIRKQNKSFSNTRSAVPIKDFQVNQPPQEKKAPKPIEKAPEVSNSDDKRETNGRVNSKKGEATKRFNELKEKASKNGKSTIDVLNAIKKVLDIKGNITLDMMAADLGVFDEVEKIITGT